MWEKGRGRGHPINIHLVVHHPPLLALSWSTFPFASRGYLGRWGPHCHCHCAKQKLQHMVISENIDHVLQIPNNYTEGMKITGAMFFSAFSSCPRYFQLNVKKGTHEISLRLFLSLCLFCSISSPRLFIMSSLLNTCHSFVPKYVLT